MEGMKKGVLYTLSVFLVSTSLLYLLASASLYSNSLKTTTTTASSIESINAYSDGVRYQIKSLLASEVVNITVTENEGNTDVVFEEELPAGNGYSEALLTLKEFVEADIRFNTTMNITEARKPKLCIMPCNLTVDHHAGKVVFLPEDSQESEEKIAGYSVLIRTNESVPELNWTLINEAGPFEEEALYFHMGLQGKNGVVSTTKYVDRGDYSELRLVDSDNESVFVFQIDAPGSLTINYNTNAKMEATAHIRDTVDNVYVELGRDILTVTSGETKKISGVVFSHEG